ncbi:Histone-lysine N-methyltransferase SETD2 [Fasciola gigantica]|uniref:Histone-lysine N-methyltransferase SETD2 n=1 Tax=Fasciola gigantica TaxID=46835 RepID=A0A504YHL7_FASGI|nr:Histone-lysine N-methyltransferase SETD2 [Fasciola gigantica]
MNNKRSEVGGGKYNECVRLMSPDRSIMYTRGRMTHTDDLRQKYTVTTNFQRPPKRYKDGNVHSGFADSDATALLGIKKSQGNLSSLDQKPAPFPVRIAATQDNIGFGECREVIELVNLKRKRSVDDGLALKRTKNDPQSNSTNPSAFMGHLAVTTRCHTHKPDMKIAGGDTTFVPEDYHPESLPYAFRGRISRDSDADSIHVFSGQNSSRVVPKSESKFSMANCIAQVSGCSEAQLEPDSGTATSSSSPGDSANEVSDMLRSRRLPTVALENEAQSHLFGKSKGDNLAWKLQSTTRHVTDSYRQSVLLSPVNKKPRDISGAYVPGMDLLVDGSDIAPIELISRFSKTPLSSPEPFDDNSSRGLLLDDPSVSQLPHQIDSNVAQRPASSAHTSTVSAHSAGLELSHATKARYAQFYQQPKRAEPTERQPLPALHLHLSKDGTSPLPPGWQRAPNTKRQTNHANKDGSSGGGGDEVKSSDMYAYYYYHVRTRQTRWDPPVYPWDADPHDVLTSEAGEDDPEAPYNWGCASKYSVTHEEIEAMYTRLRQRILERQCTELLHDVAGRSDAPQGAAEQGFAIEASFLTCFFVSEPLIPPHIFGNRATVIRLWFSLLWSIMCFARSAMHGAKLDEL